MDLSEFSMGTGCVYGEPSFLLLPGCARPASERRPATVCVSVQGDFKAQPPKNAALDKLPRSEDHELDRPSTFAL